MSSPNRVCSKDQQRGVRLATAKQHDSGKIPLLNKKNRMPGRVGFRQDVVEEKNSSTDGGRS